MANSRNNAAHGHPRAERLRCDEERWARGEPITAENERRLLAQLEGRARQPDFCAEAAAAQLLGLGPEPGEDASPRPKWRTRPKWSAEQLDKIAAYECHCLGLGFEPEALFARQPRGGGADPTAHQARAEIAWRLNKLYGVPQRELERLLHVDRRRVEQLVRDGREITEVRETGATGIKPWVPCRRPGEFLGRDVSAQIELDE